MTRTTRADVARKAGVAPSTVSLILNGHGHEVKIAPATIEHVTNVAREMNYVPNAAARSLRRGSTNIIALIMAELPEDPFVPVVHKVLTTAMIEVQRRGYLLLPLFQPEGDAANRRFIQSVLSDIQLAGAICETTSTQQFVGPLLSQLDIPVMWMSMIETSNHFGGVGLVSIDEGTGVREILSDLDATDTSRALYLAGPNINHFRQVPVLEHFQDRAEFLSLPTWSAHDSYEACMRMLTAHPDIDSVWCADDTQAPGVFSAARDLGKHVPNDLSVIGFGDHNAHEDNSMGLTTVMWPLQDMTATAVSQLIDSISTPKAEHTAREPHHTRVSTTPTWRTSAKRIHKN